MKNLAEKILNPNCCTDRALQVGYNNTIGSLQNNRANSASTIAPNYPESEIRCVNTILRKIAAIYATLFNQFKFICQTVFSARFDKQDEDGQILDENELFFNLSISQNSTQFDIDNVIVRC